MPELVNKSVRALTKLTTIILFSLDNFSGSQNIKQCNKSIYDDNLWVFKDDIKTCFNQIDETNPKTLTIAKKMGLDLPNLLVSKIKKYQFNRVFKIELVDQIS